jgi:hypothetical protein
MFRPANGAAALAVMADILKKALGELASDGRH